MEEVDRAEKLTLLWQGTPADCGVWYVSSVLVRRGADGRFTTKKDLLDSLGADEGWVKVRAGSRTEALLKASAFKTGRVYTLVQLGYSLYLVAEDRLVIPKTGRGGRT